MKITVIGRQMNVYDEMKDLIERKLAKFDKYFSGEADATVTLSCKHNEKNLEITISAGQHALSERGWRRQLPLGSGRGDRYHRTSDPPQQNTRGTAPAHRRH